MKKVTVFTIALILAGFVAGCGGGGGGGGGSAAKVGSTSSESSNTPTVTSSVTNDDSLKLTQADKALNITYKSVATGEWPPSPPVSNAPDARDAAK